MAICTGILMNPPSIRFWITTNRECHGNTVDPENKAWSRTSRYCRIRTHGRIPGCAQSDRFHVAVRRHGGSEEIQPPRPRRGGFPYWNEVELRAHGPGR